METYEVKRILETALICASQPMSMREMRSLFEDTLSADALHAVLDDLAGDWRERGLELVALASGWRFQTRPGMRDILDRLHPEKPPKYSRAVLETLAIIAYRQPVTRGDIEDIRGIVVGSQIVKQLEDRGWIESIGHRDTPGRPALYATTRQFLDDLGLASLADLPPLDAQLGQLASSGAEIATLPLEEVGLPGLATPASVDEGGAVTASDSVDDGADLAAGDAAHGHAVDHHAADGDAATSHAADVEPPGDRDATDTVASHPALSNADDPTEPPSGATR